MGFESKARTGGWLTWDLAPPSAAGLGLTPTGGRDGGSFLLTTLSWTVAWRLFLAPSWRWTECRGKSLLWLRMGSCLWTPSGLRLLQALVSMAMSGPSRVINMDMSSLESVEMRGLAGSEGAGRSWASLEVGNLWTRLSWLPG